ncbi:MAG: hypothetical protein CMF59_15900 [Leptospiraceae bacterium]|nr:hypothetical protein [Leptospiraceae bacterium]
MLTQRIGRSGTPLHFLRELALSQSIGFFFQKAIDFHSPFQFGKFIGLVVKRWGCTMATDYSAALRTSLDGLPCRYRNLSAADFCSLAEIPAK